MKSSPPGEASVSVFTEAATMRTAKGSSFHSTLPLLLLLLAMVAKTSSPLKILSPILRIRNTTTTENTEEKDDPPRISMASVFDTLSYKSAEAGPDCEGALKIFGSEREIALGKKHLFFCETKKVRCV